MSRVAELEFGENAFVKRWKNVREDFWGDLKAQNLRALPHLLETSWDMEIQDWIGARRWGSGPHRNGRCSRTLLTGYGWISH